MGTLNGRDKIMEESKVTREQEEIQTLERFIRNCGQVFIPGLAIQDKSKIKEPSDVFYKGTDYQITYGDREHLAKSRKATNKNGTYFTMRSHSKANYAEELLNVALDEKKDKSDNKMTLLVDCTYTSWLPISERETLCRKYFNDNIQKLRGSWCHIFVVFPDGNVQLR